MQRLVGLVMLAAIGYGFGAFGVRGAVTAAVADLAIGTGLAMAYWRVGVNIAGTPQERAAQRVWGLVSAAGAAVGVFYGGWRWGWAWALGGFAAGCVAAPLLALFHLVDLGQVPSFTRPNERSSPDRSSTQRANELSAHDVPHKEDIDRQIRHATPPPKRTDASSLLVLGDFDVSGLTVDTHTGEVGGKWIELAEGAAKHLDHLTVAELCRCCGVELLRSGSKWSVWFCKECKPRVEDLNRNAGTCVVPIGRHTLMHGIGVRGADAVRDPVQLAAFAAAANDFMAKQDRLSQWASEIVKRNCARCALIGEQPIPMSTYLTAVAAQSREQAFRDMCEWWRDSHESPRRPHSTR